MGGRFSEDLVVDSALDDVEYDCEKGMPGEDEGERGRRGGGEKSAVR